MGDLYETVYNKGWGSNIVYRRESHLIIVILKINHVCDNNSVFK